MFDIIKALKAHKAKCEQVISESEEAENSYDVDCAYADWCEAQGMEMLLVAAYGKTLSAISVAASRLQCEAWSAWNDANNRINYDPVTGNPRRV